MNEQFWAGYSGVACEDPTVKTWRFMGRAFVEGLKRWKESILWTFVPSLLGLVGVSLTASRFWSVGYIWQGVAILAFSALLIVGSGAYSMADEQCDETNRLIRENAVLREAALEMPPEPPIEPAPAALNFSGVDGLIIEDSEINGYDSAIHAPHSRGVEVRGVRAKRT